MMGAKYVLRDLPGVADLESRLKRIESHPNPSWAPEYDGFEKAVARLTERLFGIEEEQLWEYSLDLEDDETPEVIAKELEEEDGWDLRDKSGEYLAILPHLLLAMSLATDGELGHLPDLTHDRDLTDRQKAEAEANLEEAAAKFLRERKKGR